MLILLVKNLAEPFTPELESEKFLKKILVKIMNVFIKSKETDLYPLKENVFTIISLVANTKKGISKNFIKTFRKQ